LKAEPQRTGNKFDLAGQTPNGRFQDLWSDRLILDHQLGQSPSSCWKRVNQFGEAAWADSFSSAGMSVTSYFKPTSSSRHKRSLFDHQVNDTTEVILFANWQKDRVSVRAEFLAHIVKRISKFCAGAIHLIDETIADLVFGRLPPHGFPDWVERRNAQKTATPSRTRIERSTSAVKST